MRPPRVTDAVVEVLVSRVLRGGVLLAAVVTTVGAVIYLAQHPGQSIDYSTFTGASLSAGSTGESIMALGLVLLVATPIARVALLAVAFLLEHDRLYTAVSTLVLAVLLVSIVAG
jgi:uncharacterized membrane protein